MSVPDPATTKWVPVWDTGTAAGGSLVPPVSYGITLPAAPVDGEEAILVDSLTAPKYQWRFRYSAAITDANKWVFIGGSPGWNRHGFSGTTTTVNNWVDMSDGPQPPFTLPRSGFYVCHFGAIMRLSYVGLMYAGIGIGSTFYGPVLLQHEPVANADQAVSGMGLVYNGVAGQVVKQLYQQGAAGTLYANDRWIIVWPTRVA